MNTRVIGVDDYEDVLGPLWCDVCHELIRVGRCEDDPEFTMCPRCLRRLDDAGFVRSLERRFGPEFVRRLRQLRDLPY